MKALWDLDNIYQLTDEQIKLENIITQLKSIRESLSEYKKLDLDGCFADLISDIEGYRDRL